MSNWTHDICYDCWDKKNPDRPAERNNLGYAADCCYCGARTRSGIPVRDDPANVPNCPGHP